MRQSACIIDFPSKQENGAPVDDVSSTDLHLQSTSRLLFFFYSHTFLFMHFWFLMFVLSPLLQKIHYSDTEEIPQYVYAQINNC